MKKVVISEFKAKCIAFLREAQQTGESILVTRLLCAEAVEGLATAACGRG